MKPTRLLALLLILIFSCSLLISCGGDEIAFSEVYLADYADWYHFPVFSKATDATPLSTLTATPSNSSTSVVYPLYVVTTTTNSLTTYHVYNPDLDQIVFSEANTETTTVFITLTNYDFFSVKIQNSQTGKIVKTSLYTTKGTLIVTEDKDISVPGDELYGAFAFGNQLIEKVDENEYRKICDIPELFGEVTNLIVSENYLIKKTDTTVIFYDHSLNLVASYRLPSYAEEAKMGPLADESLLIQYRLQEVEDAEEYDFVSDGKKYSLYLLRFDPATNETEDIDLGDIILENVMNDLLVLDMEDFVNTENVPNIVEYYKIENRRINTTRSYTNVLDNDCELGAALDNFVAGQESMAFPYNETLFFAEQTNGYVIMDANGTLKKAVNNYPNVRAFGFYDSTNKVIYNADFEQAYTIPVTATIKQNAYNGILFTNRDENNKTITYLYTKAGLQTILSATDTTKYLYRNDSDHYVIYDSEATQKYSYYSIDGTLLFSDEKVYTVVAKGEDSILLRASGENNTYLYKRLAV